MPPKKNILGAMFDVKPMKKSGVVDLEKIMTVGKEVNLKPKVGPKTVPFANQISYEASIKTKTFPKLSDREMAISEIEKIISGNVDLEAELVAFGGSLRKNKPADLSKQEPAVLGESLTPEPKNVLPADIYETEERPEPESQTEPPQQVAASQPLVEAELVSYQPEIDPSAMSLKVEAQTKTRPSGLEKFWFKKSEQTKNRKNLVRSQVISGSVGLHEVEALVAGLRQERRVILKKNFKSDTANTRKIFIPASLAIFAFLSLSVRSGFELKNNVLKNGDNAVANLESAKQNLKNFDFKNAADGFALAHDDFDKASNTLGQLGASLISIFGDLPGLDKVKAASNIVTAGRNISNAGENLSLAFATLYKTNPFSGFLDNKQVSFSKTLSDFRDVLKSADKNISNAQQLLADINADSLPADKKDLLAKFDEKIPDFKNYISGAISYSDLLYKMLGANGAGKTYIVLLQNNSELRANGGFAGSYALVTFSGGYLKEIKVDDVYNTDGQLRENIIPPRPLQHITPNWGMRDANWFADFPSSAAKIEQFFGKETGRSVDGVISLTPDLIDQILEITGPIEMPEYKITLSSSNFLSQIQEEVEYGQNRNQPKTILKDLQPKFFQKLAQQDQEHLKQILKVILDSIEGKHILAYFNDRAMEETVLNSDFGGQVKNSQGDYLQVVFSNIKGSKTDAVTDSSFDLKVSQSDDQGLLEHTLKISRIHNGGDSKLGFYNKTNPDYVRIYVPQGSKLTSIDGQSITDFKPLINYDNTDFQTDRQLAEIESIIDSPFRGVEVTEESGKTVFGFWLVLKPKEKKTVTLNYETKQNLTGGYSLLWQKQSGTENDLANFAFSLNPNREINSKSDELREIGNSLSFNAPLFSDKIFSFNFK